jgi:prepilin-type N-terminal cleavage/methylation domain-containing protein
MMSKAFTLIELLVVVMVIGAIGAITTPSIIKIRKDAQTIVALSDLRQHSQVFVAYTGDHADHYPFYLDPKAHYTILRHGDISIPTPYWLGYFFWNIPLAGYYYDDDPWQAIFHPPQFKSIYQDGLRGHGSGYYYGHVFISRPTFWSSRTRLGDNSQRGSTSFSEVAFPSSKGILRDEWSYSNNTGGDSVGQSINIGFCDGSARSVPPIELLSGYPGGVGAPWNESPARAVAGPVMATIDGVLGRDVR